MDASLRIALLWPDREHVGDAHWLDMAMHFGGALATMDDSMAGQARRRPVGLAGEPATRDGVAGVAYLSLS